MMRWLCVLWLNLATTTLFAQSSLIDSIINPASLKDIVEFLAADSLKGRLTSTPGEQTAGEFIARAFQKAGALPITGNDGYFMYFNYAWKDKPHTSRNVVAVLPGTELTDEVVIFSAHYDHVGTKATNPVNFLPEKGKPEKNDSIYNGANDNASGISALISIARYFGKLANNKRTIMLIAFSGEELGLMGSREMIKTINVGLTKAMINMDMLGVGRGRRNTRPFITGAEYSNLDIIMNNRLHAINPELYRKNYFIRDPFPDDNLFSRSDNYWFATRGIPSHTVMVTSPHNRYYHSLNDEPATIDFKLLTQVIKAIALGATAIIDGPATPKRIVF